MIDTHMHADARSSDDFELMFHSGIVTAITCSYYPYRIPHEMILLNHLNRILELDTARARQYGLDLKVALGIHPTNSSINPESIFKQLYRWIDEKQIVAIGEIGLEDLTESEIDIFKKQLDIASETDSKVIIHTPRKNKPEVLKVILDIIPQHIDEKQAVIDHINLYPKIIGNRSDLALEIKHLPSVKPTYTDEEIDKAQAVEQAYVDKMVELAVEEMKRPKGKWIEIEIDAGEFIYKCTKCGMRVINPYKYCPICGSYNGGEKE